MGQRYQLRFPAYHLGSQSQNPPGRARCRLRGNKYAQIIVERSEQSLNPNLSREQHGSI
jgi:hypothetical protein